MNRRIFVKNTVAVSAGLMLSKVPSFAGTAFPVVRVPAAKPYPKGCAYLVFIFKQEKYPHAFT